MNAKAEQTNSSSPIDIIKLVLAVLLVVGGIVAFYHFDAWSTVVRGLTMLAAVVAGLAVAAFTEQGRATREFLGEAQFELRKVVWPTRDETLRTTGVIVIVVIILSLLLGLIDLTLKWVVLDNLLKIGH